ncbi:MAG: SGNH/GDSL hydrolase family protein [Pseudobdellovibrio sp.]
MKIIFSFFLFLSLTVATYAQGIKPIFPIFERIVVFGDSLSDLGTYKAYAGARGGGKFTTNPGKLWIEVVADYLNLPVSANRQEGFGIPLKLLGGFDYAQGGARISEPAITTLGKDSARSVEIQLGYFLSEQSSFKDSDIVFLLAGANDEQAYLNAVASGTMTPEDAVKATAFAAAKLAAIVQKISDSGATHVIVLNLPMIEKTPRALSQDPQTQGFISVVTKTFNQTLQAQLANKNVLLIDFYSFDEKFNLAYESYGFTNITSPACRLQLLPGKSSLFCTKGTLVSPRANKKFKFADTIHPTTGFSKVAGDFVWSELQKYFLSK